MRRDLFQKILSDLASEAEERANDAANGDKDIEKDLYTAVAGLLDNALRRLGA